MIENILEKLKNEYENILKDNLVGIYVHGSIAFGCFTTETSDIDFIVVVNDKLSYTIQNSLIKKLIEMNGFAPKKGFEMSVVLSKYCLNFDYPTPYELHFSNGWLGKYLNNPHNVCNEEFKTDKDLAAHFTIIKNCGQVLCGKPINEVFGDVKEEHYIDSIYYDIAHAKEDIIDHPTYIILNLCRVFAYLKDRKILSKEQGGLWGLENLPLKYQDVIQNALDDYKNNVGIHVNETDRLHFAEHIVKRIKNLL